LIEVLANNIDELILNKNIIRNEITLKEKNIFIVPREDQKIIK